MMHMILAGLAMVFLLNGFHYVYCFSGVERAYFGLYKGIVEEATMIVNYQGKYLSVPAIHIGYLKTLLEDYFAVELKPYCRSYDYSVTAPGFYLLPTSATKVVITMNARIDDIHTFQKSASFRIQEASTL